MAILKQMATHSSFMNIMSVTLIIIILLLSPSSNATSCKEVEYFIYGKCSQNACSDIIFVDSEMAYGSCSRVPSVKDGTSVHKQILELEVFLASPNGSGTYKLEFTRDWYFSDYKLESLRHYIALHKHIGVIPHRSTSAKLSEIPNRVFERIEERWIAKGIDQKRDLNWKLFKDSIAMLVALVVLFVSMFFYVDWLRNSGQWRNLKIVAILQAGVIGYGFLLVDSFRIEIIGTICIVLTSSLVCLEIFSTFGLVVWKRINSSGLLRH